ncbi:Small auxin-up RNA [Dillenia turbinata]|uniref:Small auxin-up RNA n=1 Tax=Dillenia turbinata TaxID=194707 RepID=A0AAN8W9U0_9MAGN
MKKMLGKKMGSMKKLAKKVKVIGGSDHQKPPRYVCLLGEGEGHESPSSTTPTGFFAIYVGEERQRFVVPTSYLSHPLFKMLLEKASDEFGYDQKEGLVVPCSVSTFQEVLSAVECCNGKFQFGDFIEELI